MRKVLVVDDDTDILEVVDMALTMNEYLVKAISNWEEINAALDEFGPELVLLDVSLRGADGRDICKEIKTSQKAGHLPVILFSANQNMGAFIIDCHAQAFIPKPFELGHLIDTVKKYLPTNASEEVID